MIPSVKINAEYLVPGDEILPSRDVVESALEDQNGNVKIIFTNGKSTTVPVGTVVLAS